MVENAPAGKVAVGLTMVGSRHEADGKGDILGICKDGGEWGMVSSEGCKSSRVVFQKGIGCSEIPQASR